MSRRVDQWEVVAAVALARGKNETVSAYKVAVGLDKLARIARTLHRLYEDACNVPVRICDSCASKHEGPIVNRHTPTKCHYARCERLQARATAIGAELSIVVEHQTDPRGAPIKLWADKVDGRSLGYMGLS